ncbi:MAG: hypothetical protein Q4E29_14150 [Lachnospiraceae bacterium]|nr:hypothetical protein [Lachnospiraceae bacterium]
MIAAARIGAAIGKGIVKKPSLPDPTITDETETEFKVVLCCL